MHKWLLVGLGGGLGAVARYWLSGLVQEWLRNASFPYGTLVVNVAGCFIIGALAYLSEARGLLTAETRLLLITGFLGGFTTFSTFGNETLALARGGELGPALGNVAAHVGMGLSAVWAGWALGQLIWR
jgi:fluoride exporter